jgi:hypothetical protein
VQLFDPLLHENELPIQAVSHPLGFRLNLSTNSRHVMEAANEAWGGYRSQFERQPIELRVNVQAEGARADEPPVYHCQGDLHSIVYDRDNYAVFDLESLAGFCFVSEKTAADHLRLRIYFLEGMTYTLLAQRHAVPVHAACVARGDSGTLLCGNSGVGKSTLAFACARAGWSYISDDATWLVGDAAGREAIGIPQRVRFREDAPILFPELASYAARPWPHGKVTIEVPTAEVSGIRTAARCRIDRLVLLDRLPGVAPRPVRMASGELVEQMMADRPYYGRRTYEFFERNLGRLKEVPACRLQYQTLDQAIELLTEFEAI